MSDMELTPTASPSTAVPSGIAMAITRPEGEEQDERRDQQPDELAHGGLRLLERPVEIATHLEPQPGSRLGLGAERLEVPEVLGRELVHERVLQADERNTPVRRQDLRRPEDVGQCRGAAAAASRSADRASAESANVASSSSGVTTS